MRRHSALLAGILQLGLLAGIGRAAGPAPEPIYEATIISYADVGVYFPKALNDREEWAGLIGAGAPERAVRRTLNEIVKFGTLPGGAASRFTALSNEKWAAGFSIDSNGVQRAVLGWDGYLEDLSFFQPAAHGASEALGISDLGHVTGWVATPGGAKRAFRYFKGNFFILPSFDESHIGYDIEETGTVVGVARQSSGKERGFLYRQRIAAPEYVPTLGGDSSAAYAIDGFYRITGEAQTSAGVNHAFLYDFTNGAMIDLGVLEGHKSSKGLAINSHAQVVGESLDEFGRRRGFLYAHGRMYDLNGMVDPRQPLIIVSAIAINDSGSILVEGAYSGVGVTAHLKLTRPLLESATIDPNSVQIVNGSSLHFMVHGPLGSNYVVQASADFKNWETLLGSFRFYSYPITHQFEPGVVATNRFFRLKMVE